MKFPLASLAFLFFLCLCMVSTAQQVPSDSTASDCSFFFHYRLNEPDLRLPLPESLKEISGLSPAVDSSEVLFAIQDEEGILFQIDKKTGTLLDTTLFYKKGDYEGLELVGDTLYVVKSTGTIYQVSNLKQMPPTVQKHKFFLSKSNDVEGLCYDKKQNRLLLACKGESITEEDGAERAKFEKVIYAFRLDDKQMDLTPVLRFSLEDLYRYLENCKPTEQHDKLCEYFHPDAERFIFSPSAIAIHPITQNIYLTSAHKKLLLVLSSEGKVLHLQKMNKAVHPQPEGLAFDPDGTLYIANEGKKGAGTILVFRHSE
ncbi:MAG TPA: hypothetical protein ENJ45_03225 [Phaeodactylibacter sp.]|nr:hypothetical protein [Phaeodactylibacter sp.]